MAETTILSVTATTGSKLSDLAIKNGQMVFVRDKHKIAFDFDDKRVIYREITELSTEASRISLLAPISGNYYFVVETATLWAYRDGGWIQISGAIDKVMINGADLTIANKSVNIPLANSDTPGVVRGSNANNGVTIGADGSMTVGNIEQDKIIGLPDLLATKIEKVKINGTELAVNSLDKSINIPIALSNALGVVKGTTMPNGVSVAEDGTMSVNSLNVNKLYQTEEDILVLYGGNSVGFSANEAEPSAV